MPAEKTRWDQAVEFHGHSCMGLAVGFRVSEAALLALGSSRDLDEELIAVVENDSCAVDAIQVMTGCTLGKGNLIYKDYGKQVYTFALRPQGKAVRIVVKRRREEPSPRFTELRHKISRGEATAEEEKTYRDLMAERINEFLSRPLEEVLEMHEIEFTPPEKAKVFATVKCGYCGEEVMEPRARIKNGQVACIPCAVQYSRGWGKEN